MPCGDIILDNDKAEHIEFSEITNKENQKHDHDHSESDLCSPFCSCNCCHAQTIDFRLITLEILQPYSLQLSTLHFDSRGIDYHNSLLQPPRA